MRFGLFVPQGWRLDLAGINPKDHWNTMLDVARIADAGPYESYNPAKGWGRGPMIVIGLVALLVVAFFVVRIVVSY